MNRLHTKAFLTHFELACEFAILIVFTDLVWLVHDILSNGWNAWYIAVAAGLTIGLIGTITVLVKHHKRYTHRLVRKSKLHYRKTKYKFTI